MFTITNMPQYTRYYQKNQKPKACLKNKIFSSKPKLFFPFFLSYRRIVKIYQIAFVMKKLILQTKIYFNLKEKKKLK